MPRLNIKEIPPHEARYVALSTIRAVKRYFEQPEIKEKYDKWLEEYKARKEAEKCKEAV